MNQLTFAKGQTKGRSDLYKAFTIMLCGANFGVRLRLKTHIYDLGPNGSWRVSQFDLKVTRP